MSDVRACTFGFGQEHSSLRESIAAIDWVRLIGAGDAEDLNRGLEFEIAVVNLEWAGGLETVRTIALKRPQDKIIGIGDSDPQKIIHAMREGCAQYVPNPVEDKELKAAFQSARPNTTTERQTICIVGSSSGAGATTVVCNLAMELASRAERCAVVDLDLEFGSVACAFDCEPKYTVADICRVGAIDRLDKTVLSEALTERNGVSMLGRPHEMDQANDIDPAAVDKAIRLLGEMFPYVLIDLSRINGELGRAALRHADRVLIVVQLNVTCVRTAERIFNMAREAGVDAAKIEVVVNRAQSENSLAGKKMEAFLKAPIFAYLPNDYSQVRMSLDMGVSANDNSPVRYAARQMAAKLAGEVIEAQARPSIFSRLLTLNFKRGPAPSVAPQLRPHTYLMYGVAATAAVVTFMMALPWFSRIAASVFGAGQH